MNIESFFPGRLRVSSELFTTQENVDKIVERVNTIDGIKNISSNLRTGSITVLYNPLAISMDMLMEAKAEIERLEGELN